MDALRGESEAKLSALQREVSELEAEAARWREACIEAQAGREATERLQGQLQVRRFSAASPRTL